MSEVESEQAVSTAVDERGEAVRLREELDDVESALARLDDGTYGICQVCDSAIPDEHLALVPQAQMCPNHQA
jgi:DnaK suppressor protein